MNGPADGAGDGFYGLAPSIAIPLGKWLVELTIIDSAIFSAGRVLPANAHLFRFPATWLNVCAALGVLIAMPVPPRDTYHGDHAKIGDRRLTSNRFVTGRLRALPKRLRVPDQILGKTV